MEELQVKPNNEKPRGIIVVQQLDQEGIQLNDKKRNFIQQLFTSLLLPQTSNVHIQSDGRNIDIFWEDQLLVGLTDEDTVAVSDYSSGHQIYEYFEKLDQTAIDYIVKCYENVTEVQ